MAHATPLKIGILVGSARERANGRGVTRWVHDHVVRTLKQRGLGDETNVAHRDTNTPPLPLGQLFSPTPPRMREGRLSNGIRDYGYEDPKTREWSAIVQSLSGLILVVTEYNGMITGEMKNAIDHLGMEWEGLPIALVGYGKRGGARSTAALRFSLGVILRAKIIGEEDTLVVLPDPSYTKGPERVHGDEEILTQHDEALRKQLEGLLDLIAERTSAKGKDEISNGPVNGHGSTKP